MKSGIVAIVGRPNVGKSTIINGLLNSKISIVTDKSQTTRDAIRGIYNDFDSQIVFIDTPGIHKPHAVLGEEMNKLAFSSAHDVDTLLLVVDASKPFGEGDEFIIKHLDFKSSPLIIALNKIDLVRIDFAQNLIKHYQKIFPHAKIVELSAKDKFNLDTLLKEIKNNLKDGPLFYPSNIKTDKDEIFQIKEIIREKTLKCLKEEVPHAISIYIDDIFLESNPAKIYASLIVEKESQKGIVIGKGGKIIKLIGSKARQDIEYLLKRHVYLSLVVKVVNDWRNNESSLKKFGYKLKK